MDIFIQWIVIWKWGGTIAYLKEQIFEAQMSVLADLGMDVGDRQWNPQQELVDHSSSTSGHV